MAVMRVNRMRNVGRMLAYMVLSSYKHKRCFRIMVPDGLERLVEFFGMMC